MPKTLIISPMAQVEIDEILEYVAEFTGFGTSADLLYEAIFRKLEMIAFMPSAIGRLREDGSREAFARRYRIVYEETEDAVWIISVIHSSRIYPRQPL